MNIVMWSYSGLIANPHGWLSGSCREAVVGVEPYNLAVPDAIELPVGQ